jgi:hypothetical protein
MDTQRSPNEANSVVIEHHRSHNGKEWQNMIEGRETEDGLMDYTGRSGIPQHRESISRLSPRSVRFFGVCN